MTAKPPILILASLLAATVFADGLVLPPIDYKGSLNETAQEAIIIFHPGDGTTESSQDLVLKISVKGEADTFSWVVPLPGVPEIGKADAAMFEELHNYVQARTRPRKMGKSLGISGFNASKEELTVELIKREIVGSYDVAIVREQQDGGLLLWLKENAFQTPEKLGELIASYHEKGYVFACMKVSDATLRSGKSVDLHPIRFRFSTGGRDGIFFPMRMTGLQQAPFHLNLYVFYDKWINDKLSRFGFTHRGLNLRWRDYDSRACKSNEGKHWAKPEDDPYLKGYADIIPAVSHYMAQHFENRRYCLSNIFVNNLRPATCGHGKTTSGSSPTTPIGNSFHSTLARVGPLTYYGTFRKCHPSELNQVFC
jgi:hypothetical protein